MQDWTHGGGSGGAKEGEQVPALHQLHDDEVRVVVQADAEQPQDVLVLEVLHQYGLFQELLLLLFRCTLSQRLQKNNQHKPEITKATFLTQQSNDNNIKNPQEMMTSKNKKICDSGLLSLQHQS